MVWQDEDKKVTARWRAGAIFAIPLNAWHQHINIGPEPARLIRLASLGSRAPALSSMGKLSVEDIAIDNEEDPRIREILAAELKKSGIPLRMPSVEEFGSGKN